MDDNQENAVLNSSYMWAFAAAAGGLALSAVHILMWQKVMDDPDVGIFMGTLLGSPLVAGIAALIGALIAVGIILAAKRNGELKYLFDIPVQVGFLSTIGSGILSFAAMALTAHSPQSPQIIMISALAGGWLGAFAVPVVRVSRRWEF